jgi:hypothetical protein
MWSVLLEKQDNKIDLERERVAEKKQGNNTS